MGGIRSRGEPRPESGRTPTERGRSPRGIRLARAASDESGQMLVFGVVLLTVMLVIGAVVVDAGLAFSEKDGVQTATDAAVLAAIKVKATGGSTSAVFNTACDYFKRNGYDTNAPLNSCPNLDVNSPPTRGPNAGNTNYLEVIGESTSGVGFMNIFANVGVLSPSARSVAKYTAGTDAQSPCGLCLLGTSGTTLDMHGNGSVNINTPVSVNSTANQALSASGDAVLNASAINVVGGVNEQGNAELNPNPTTGVTPIADPLAGASAPSVSNPIFGSVSYSSNATINPGIYTSITVQGGTVTMNPGVYVLRNNNSNGISLSGNGTLQGTGVMLYFTCNNYPTSGCNAGGQQGARFNAQGNSIFRPRAPTSGAYKGLLIFFDRNNTNGISLSGNANLDIIGSVYAKSGTLNLQGNGSPVFHSLMVFRSATITGNGSIVYNSTENFPAGGTGGSSATTALVE